MATSRSLQRKKEQLKADQDVLVDRWTKVLATEKYELDSPAKGIHGTTGYLNSSRKTTGTHPNAHTSLRSKTVRSICKEAPSSLGATTTNVRSRKRVPGPINTSPVNGQRAAQAYSARATYSINHVKFMALLEGRQSIPIENAGSSKQSGWSCAGNNEGRRLVKRPPRA